ncbi:hypothetical protein CLU79DRAFT_849143 [Phycomyces nitens]|nr:hypothetical protein CLU79DRAFT_849143 [Phycomyces nitens]
MTPCLGPKNGNKVKKKHETLDSTQMHGPFWIVYKDSTFLHFPLILHIFTSSHSTMQIFSIQKRILSKCQRRQSQKTSNTTTKSRSSFTSSMGQCIKSLTSVKKAFSCSKVQNTVPPSLISSSSTISNDSYLSDFSDDEHFQASEKSMALDALIFDHPSVTVCIRPAAYRSS